MLLRSSKLWGYLWAWIWFAAQICSLMSSATALFLCKSQTDVTQIDQIQNNFIGFAHNERRFRFLIDKKAKVLKKMPFQQRDLTQWTSRVGFFLFRRNENTKMLQRNRINATEKHTFSSIFVSFFRFCCSTAPNRMKRSKKKQPNHFDNADTFLWWLRQIKWNANSHRHSTHNNLYWNDKRNFSTCWITNHRFVAPCAMRCDLF